MNWLIIYDKQVQQVSHCLFSNVPSEIYIASRASSALTSADTCRSCRWTWLAWKAWATLATWAPRVEQDTLAKAGATWAKFDVLSHVSHVLHVHSFTVICHEQIGMGLDVEASKLMQIKRIIHRSIQHGADHLEEGISWSIIVSPRNPRRTPCRSWSTRRPGRPKNL